MNHKKCLLLWLPVLLLAGAASCATEECLGNKSSLPLAGFYSSSVSPKSISIDSLTVFGLGAPNDTLLHDSYASISQIYLPFDFERPSTTYVFQYLQRNIDGLEDRITFDYEVQPYFVSAACGVVYKYKMTGIETTHVLIDSVTCPSGVIDNADSQNIRIYFRTSQ